jgi:hypothetical protein
MGISIYLLLCKGEELKNVPDNFCQQVIQNQCKGAFGRDSSNFDSLGELTL